MKRLALLWIGLAVVTALAAAQQTPPSDPVPATSKQAKTDESNVRYALILKEGGATYSGFSSKELEPYLKDLKQDLLLVKKDRDTYLIKDKDLVKAARAAMAESTSLSRDMRTIGEGQRAIGTQQRDSGERLQQFGEQQGNLARAIEQAAKEGKDVSALLKEADANASTMAKLGAEINDLGTKMAEFGKQMGDMESKLSRVIEADRAKLRKVIAEAFEKGLAIKQSK